MRDYVTSDDVLFVEKKIKSLKYYPTPNELWKEMHNRFRTKAELGAIIELFENENKLIFDKEGKLIWIKNQRLMNVLNTRGFVVL